MPIAHFFINRISAEIQTKLVQKAIKRLYYSGVIVHSFITCDGTTINMNTMKNLGCNFDLIGDRKPLTSFKHPYNNSNIYIIMNPCHMLKLCRNTLAAKNITSSLGTISFQYIRDLHNHQQTIGLKYANKLSAIHIDFHNKKMKVCLATQTISNGG